MRTGIWIWRQPTMVPPTFRFYWVTAQEVLPLPPILPLDRNLLRLRQAISIKTTNLTSRRRMMRATTFRCCWDKATAHSQRPVHLRREPARPPLMWTILMATRIWIWRWRIWIPPLSQSCLATGRVLLRAAQMSTYLAAAKVAQSPVTT